MDVPTNWFRAHRWLAPALIASFAWGAVLLAIDPAGDYPTRWSGPGLTVDERFNVFQGTWMADSLLETDYSAFRESVDFLPDHPPLGRLWIGFFHEAAWLLSPPQLNHTRLSVACARTAPATAFALLVFLVGYAATRWYSPLAGVVAAVSLVLMPRLFGHAHLAALETFIGLFYTLSVVGVAAYWCGPAPPASRHAIGTGMLLGLALLTKIQAVLLPLPIALWAVFVWRRKAIRPLLLWGVTGAFIFCGWPWIWSDPVAHLREYLASTSERMVLYAWYFGEKIADRDVPWHYPWLMFLTTVPLGLHLCGFWGLCAGSGPLWKSPRESLLLACILFPLVVFSLPRIAVYDGERLLLVVFPLWGIFIGRGAASLFEGLRLRMSTWSAAAILCVGLLLQSYGLFALHPCHLSYYNLLVGGLRGANSLGLPSTYWGDSVTRELLEQTSALLPDGAILYVSPVLEPHQLDFLLEQSPPLRSKHLSLRAYTPSADPAPRYVLTFLRKQDLQPGWAENEGPPGGKPLAEVRREGVRLAALFELPPAPPPHAPLGQLSP